MWRDFDPRGPTYCLKNQQNTRVLRPEEPRTEEPRPEEPRTEEPRTEEPRTERCREREKR